MEKLESSKEKLRIIAVEEHYLTPAFLQGIGKSYKTMADPANGHPMASHLSKIVDMSGELGDVRISNMDNAGVDVQVLSMTFPGAEGLQGDEAVAFARESNDYLAEVIKKYPTRFAGFATLPISVPDKAAAELARAVNDFGFKGALINGHNNGRYLDDPFFWPILESAEALQVPIYIHPTAPPQDVIKTYYTGNFSAAVSNVFALPGFGCHIETAVHLLRLILSGVFDRYPNLQVMIGHLGETLPFMLPRFDQQFPQNLTKLNRKISEYLRENVYYSFSGFNWTQAFLDLYLQVGADRIIYSGDYPWSTEDARTVLNNLPIPPVDKEKIAHGNAEKLLKL